MTEVLNEFITQAIIAGGITELGLSYIGNVKQAYELTKSVEGFVAAKKTKRLMKALAEFSKGRLLEPQIKELIDKIPLDEWESISLDAIKILEESDNDERPRLTRQLLLARLDGNIDTRTFKNLAKAIKEVPTDNLFALRKPGHLLDSVNMEVLVSYGIITRKFEVFGSEVKVKYSNYTPTFRSLFAILEMVEKEIEDEVLQEQLKI